MTFMDNTMAGFGMVVIIGGFLAVGDIITSYIPFRGEHKTITGWVSGWWD